ncbi:hypothetical protein V8E51_013304 [Hyaloscypha variabilis]
MFAHPDNHAAIETTSRPINPMALSDKIVHWTSTCLNKHENCSMPEENFVPTRLLDVSHQQGHRVLRLIESGAATQDGYCALSYCWVRTTVGHHKGNATTILVRDRYGGLAAINPRCHYSDREAWNRRLWVDSLCIIQDDTADKAREIAQMPQVYGNATVTIAASRASGVEEGFLQERPIIGLENPDAVFVLPYRSRDGQLGSTVIVPRPMVPPIGVQPLDLRAWALQERLLSPRVLDFGRHQTSWFYQTHSSAKELPTDGFQARTTLLPNRNEILESWHDVVSVYSRRALTQSADRPLAISGIATRFAKFLNSNYHAGLWEFAMASELLWYAPGPRVGRDPKVRPQTYQGPSWSWFCINDTVEWLTVQNLSVEVVQIAMTLRDEKFGAVTAASLTLKGKVLPAKWIPRRVVKKKTPLWLTYMTTALVKPEIEGNNGILEAAVLVDAVFEDRDVPFHSVTLLQVTELEGLGRKMTLNGSVNTILFIDYRDLFCVKTMIRLTLE